MQVLPKPAAGAQPNATREQLGTVQPPQLKIRKNPFSDLLPKNIVPHTEPGILDVLEVQASSAETPYGEPAAKSHRCWV